MIDHINATRVKRNGDARLPRPVAMVDKFLQVWRRR